MALGRPRDFDLDEALECAMQVFWQKGYEGASLADLTTAMGINRPSLYAAFGNKDELFRKALERYREGPSYYSREALEAPTAREVVQRMFEGAINLQMDARTPRGCLYVHGARGSAPKRVRKEVDERRMEGQTALRQRLERARAEGDLPAEADPAALARFVVTIVYGMAVQSAGGANRKELREIADQALRAWPTA